MMTKLVLCFLGMVCVASTPAWCDSDKTLPPDLETRTAMFQWPPTSDSGKAPATDWKLENPTEASLEVTPDGVHVTSDKGNPLVSCKPRFDQPLAIQVTLDYDPAKNNKLFVQIFDKFLVGYNKEIKSFYIRVKKQSALFGGDSDLLQEKKVADLKELFPDAPKVEMTIAITSDALIVWCGNLLVLQTKLTNWSVPATGAIRLGSGWKSDWTLKSVTVYPVSKMPN